MVADRFGVPYFPSNVATPDPTSSKPRTTLIPVNLRSAAATNAMAMSQMPNSNRPRLRGKFMGRFPVRSLARSDPVFAHPWPQDFGHAHRAVRLLVVLEDGEDGPGDGNRR